MLQTAIQRDYSSAVSDDPRPTTRYSAVSPKLLKRPATGLVFLVALVMICIAIFAYFSRNASSQLQCSDQSSNLSVTPEINTEAGSAKAVTNPSTTASQSPASDSNTVYSTEVETNIVNGEASTSVKINGEEVPVPAPQSPSIQNFQPSPGNSITIQNSQTSTTGSSYGTHSSTSFSHSSISTHVGGDH